MAEHVLHRGKLFAAIAWLAPAVALATGFGVLDAGPLRFLGGFGLRLRGGGHEADQRTVHRYLHRVRGGAVEGQAVDHGADDDAAADGRPLAVILSSCLFQLKSGRVSAPRWRRCSLSDVRRLLPRDRPRR